MNNKEILGYECKHAIYCPPKKNSGCNDDLTLVKEVIHYKDGTKEPNVRLLKNFKRDFYITKKEFRNHNDKKEYEDVKRLQKYSSNQSQLTSAIARAQGSPGLKTSLKMLARSQYLYGADISSTAIIKHSYMEKYPDIFSDNTVAVLDIETDVVRGDGEPIMIALTFGNKRIISIVKSFLEGMIDAEGKLRKAFTKYLSEYENENTDLLIDIADSPGKAINNVIKKAHEWKPDFIAIWNINFDLPKMNEALEKEHFDLAEVYSDPSLPSLFKHGYYYQGLKVKKKSNGEITPIHWTEQWHTMQCPASFYFIDAGCVYRRIRIAKGMEASYALDAILQKNLGIRKLKFDEILEKEAPNIKSGGLAWHQFMQKNYKIEYAVYNLFDCISVEELDKKTKDLSLTISVLCEHSDYKDFSSQPRRIVDDLHFFVQKYDKVMATTSDQMSDDNDELVVSLKDWISTLPSHLVDDNGIQCIEELPDQRSYARIYNYDLDVAGTYPTIEDILNLSKETTFRELSSIQGVPETVRRSIGINLTGGIVNAVEICCNVYKLPTFNDLLEDFQNA
jgi:hypothetical protein